MTFTEFIFKVKRRLWGNLVRYTRSKKIYPFIYRSYWHYKFSKQRYTTNTSSYFTARPNPGAGIGHQMANWIAGYWYSQQFGLKFAHFPFPSEKWEDFLGFGENEPSASELIKNQGYKRIKLPQFHEHKANEIALIKKIIKSYHNKKIIFEAEQDQFYFDQFGVMDVIKQKFHASKARENDHIRYSSKNYNIAIHVRRGDIVTGQENKNTNLLLRWQDNSYFQKVLSQVLNQLKIKKPIFIYIFSQAEQKDFSDFENFKNIHFCLDMEAQETFLHLVFADLLITSKSSFSYKPALLSNGIKVCPKDFWHGYPAKDDWILADSEGVIDLMSIKAKT